MSKLNNTFNLKSNMRCINLIISLILVCLLYIYIVKPKTENFRQKEYDKTPVFRMYYVGWCGWSDATLPKFKALGSKVKNIKIELIDCDANEELCDLKAITGYPTLQLEIPIFYPRTKTPKLDRKRNQLYTIIPYNESRDTDIMRLWLNNRQFE